VSLTALWSGALDLIRCSTLHCNGAHEAEAHLFSECPIPLCLKQITSMSLLLKDQETSSEYIFEKHTKRQPKIEQGIPRISECADIKIESLKR